jgi:L-amino acid N-acyltransferase YncA
MRTRSEYRADVTGCAAPPVAFARLVTDDDREALAALMLAAYRGTIDDEGEDLDDACDAVDDYLTRIVRPHSFVIETHDGVIGMCFVVDVGGRHYVDPIAVDARAKRAGHGRGMVAMVLASLAEAGVTEVGATITDGNVASERVFTSLGFERVGAWP